MAIKIQNQIVINDSRQLANITNLKTINNQQILGTGDIAAATGGAGGTTIKYDKGALLYAIDNPKNPTVSGDSFGHAIASYGSKVAISALYESYPWWPSNQGNGVGRVYVFDLEKDVEDAEATYGIKPKLSYVLNDPNLFFTPQGDRFGFAMDMSEKHIIVGAYQEDDPTNNQNINAGAAYIFDSRDGSLLFRLKNPNYLGTSETFDYFGYTVAIGNDYAAVSSFVEDVAGSSEAGIVYIYEVTTGRLVRTLTHPTSVSGKIYFGRALKIYGNLIAIQNFTSSFAPPMEVHVINMATGELVRTFTSNDSGFGQSIAMNGSKIVIGEPSYATNSGRFHVYDLVTGSLLRTVENPDSSKTNDYFANYMSLYENRLAVSSYNDNDGAGKAFLFDIDTGELLHTYSNPNVDTQTSLDQFGISISLSGNYLIIGANLEDTNISFNAGKAYVFSAQDSYNFSEIENIIFANEKKLSASHKIFDVRHSAGELVHTLHDPVPAVGNAFGSALGMSGNYVVVGSYNSTISGAAQAGKVSVYDTTTGKFLYDLNNPNPNAIDTFGFSVAVSNDKIVVGAIRDDIGADTDSGNVYVYDAKTGTLIQTIINPNAVGTRTGDFFGTRVAISGDRLIVSALYEDDVPTPLWPPTAGDGTSSGKAYIFNARSGTLIHTLNNPVPSDNDRFGYSVGISANYAVVSTPFEDEAGQAPIGKAYVFDVVSGNLMYTLSGTSQIDNFFGWWSDIKGSHIIIGSYGEDIGGFSNTGKVYVYSVVDGSLEYTISNPNANGTPTGDQFGRIISASEDYILVSAPSESDAKDPNTNNTSNPDGPNPGSGKVYVYEIHTGKLLTVLDNPNFNSDSSANDHFGWATSVSGKYATIGAPGESASGLADYDGKAYIFSITEQTQLDRLLTKVDYYRDGSRVTVQQNNSTV